MDEQKEDKARQQRVRKEEYSFPLIPQAENSAGFHIGYNSADDLYTVSDAQGYLATVLYFNTIQRYFAIEARHGRGSVRNVLRRARDAKGVGGLTDSERKGALTRFDLANRKVSRYTTSGNLTIDLDDLEIEI